MVFTGDEAEQITLDQGAAWTANFRAANPNATKGHFFGCKILNSILKQTGCMGIRAYYAIDDTGLNQLVFVGVDCNGKDLTSGIIAERAKPCPPYCDTTSALYGG